MTVAIVFYEDFIWVCKNHIYKNGNVKNLKQKRILKHVFVSFFLKNSF